MIYFLTVNYYAGDFIAKLISSIPASRIIAQTIVVNNSPDDNSIYQFQSDDVLILESGSNLGFGQACNLGLNWIYDRNPQAIVWIINPDTQLLPDALEKVAPFLAAHPELSIVGTIIYTPTGEVWFAGGDFIPEIGEITSKTVYDRTELPYRETSWVSGCSMLINFSKFASCPQFDRAYFLYYEDFDFCRRYANQGHLIAMTDRIGIVHQPSAITGKNIQAKFKYSTYSYLLAIKSYAKKRYLILRLARLILHAIALIPIKPKIAFGKLQGIYRYLR